MYDTLEIYLENKEKDWLKNLVNDLNVKYRQNTNYLDNYGEMFNSLDTIIKSPIEKIVICAGAGSISNQIKSYYESRKK